MYWQRRSVTPFTLFASHYSESSHAMTLRSLRHQGTLPGARNTIPRSSVCPWFSNCPAVIGRWYRGDVPQPASDHADVDAGRDKVSAVACRKLTNDSE
jgi:hypothetical protein